MKERVVTKNKTSVTPPQATPASSPLLRRSLTDEVSESVGSNSNISKELGGIQPKIIRRSLNWQNITVEAPSRGNGMSLPGEIQRQQEEPGAVIGDRASADSAHTIGQSKMAMGASPGKDPTPETIREGSVRMEQHPQYQETIRQVTEAAFEIKVTDDRNLVCVEVKEVVDSNKADRKVIRVEKTLYVLRNMRYIDLEHEVGHIKQLQERFGGNMPTERVIERNGREKKSNQRDGVLTKWQDHIIEYHNRLVEFIRLYERGASREILIEHAQGVSIWSRFYKEQGLDKGGSDSQLWVDKYFPDLRELVDQYRKLIETIKQ
jgi:hypothetical protein